MLNTREYRNMQENLEHDRMVFTNYDRQSIVFLREADERDRYYYTFDANSGLIDEIEFLSCNRHDDSELIEKDWKLDKEESTLMIGGLQSPCLDAHYMQNSKRDELGMTLRTFDGIFESEREKETFHIESMLRKLCFGSDNVDIIHQC